MTYVDGCHRIFLKSNKLGGLAGKFEVLEFKRYPYTTNQIKKVSKLIKENLTNDLLSDEIRKKYPPHHQRWENPLFGFCVPATFVLLYLMNTDTLEPMRGEDSEGEGHWWLRDIISQERHDPTCDQFINSKELESVYQSGKPKGYFGIGEMPDSKFFELIQRIQPHSKRWETDLLSIYKDFGFKTKLKALDKTKEENVD